ncbi:hypothetical protein C5O80_32880 [Burkholderia sp. SRS-46]|nr:hypothetical protein C5O80_32880 [Burkholderia sp. SRS-46]
MLLIGPVSTGGLSVEIEAVNSQSRQQEALLLLADDGGIKDFFGSFARTAHARAIAERFATETASFLSPLGRISP